MPHAATIKNELSADPRIRRVLAEWRRLTGGRGVRDADRSTLVACSGGADSSALAIALAAAPARIVLAHVVHDLRPEVEALADRDAAATLADRLGLEFVEGHAAVRAIGGNLEARARELRYHELERLAHAAGLPLVATGHHADDQLETLLMRLVRGAGPTGMGGIAPRRRLGTLTLVRPMLGLARAEAEGVCDAAGWAWRTDETNRDISRTRAAIRHEVVPALKRIAPAAGERAGATADACREAGRAIDHIAARCDRLSRVAARTGMIEWDRDRLRRLPGAVLGALIRREIIGAAGGGADRLPRRTVRRLVAAIRDDSGQARRFDLRGVVVKLTRDRVRLELSDGVTPE